MDARRTDGARTSGGKAAHRRAMRQHFKSAFGPSRHFAAAPTGIGTLIGVRMQPDELTALDAWISSHDAKLTRPQAIRRLVELGLTVRTKSKQAAAGRADRAKELASKAIDSLTVGARNDEEKASRKRRLIKGPEEFREDRVDLPEAKGK